MMLVTVLDSQAVTRHAACAVLSLACSEASTMRINIPHLLISQLSLELVTACLKLIALAGSCFYLGPVEQHIRWLELNNAVC